MSLRFVCKFPRSNIGNLLTVTPFLVNDSFEYDFVVNWTDLDLKGWLDTVLWDQVVTIALGFQDLSLTIYTEGDFCNIYASVKSEINLETFTAFDLDFFYFFNHDIWFRHVNHGHSEAQIPIDQTIVSATETLFGYRLRCDLVIGVVFKGWVSKFDISSSIESLAGVIWLVSLDPINSRPHILARWIREEVIR